MKKKLGPLQLWQWIAIGAVAGVGAILIRRHSANAGNAAATVTPADATYNPIDPTTGLPYSGGISTGGGTGSTGAPAAGPADFTDLLNNFGALEGLLAGLQQIVPPPGAAQTTDPGHVSTQTGAAPAKKAKPKSNLERAKARVTQGKGTAKTDATLLAAGYSRGQIAHAKATGQPLGKPKNPGHHVTTHAGGRRTASSSAPHNSRQHTNVAPPSHQRHPPTEHHSAAHNKPVATIGKPKSKRRGK